MEIGINVRTKNYHMVQFLLVMCTKHININSPTNHIYNFIIKFENTLSIASFLENLRTSPFSLRR